VRCRSALLRSRVREGDSELWCDGSPTSRLWPRWSGEGTASSRRGKTSDATAPAWSKRRKKNREGLDKRWSDTCPGVPLDSLAATEIV
jgi:hypothetical protein